MKLLIADDEHIIRTGLESMPWKPLDIAVCGIAKDGLEALEMAQAYQPDIILSDIRMPGLDGLELTKRVLEINPDCMVIFLSGYSDFEYTRAAITLGAFDYLLKPTDPDEIIGCVKRAVEKLRVKKNEQLVYAQMKEELKQLKIHAGQEGEPGAGTVLLSEASGSNNEKGSRNIQLILQYIREHYADEISLAALSKAFHFSPVYVNRIIKKETGHTFLDILVNFRMNKAAELLQNTDLKIVQVCEQVGINDQRYFSQVFRKTFGVAPAQFRKMAVQEERRNLFDAFDHFQV